MNRDAFSIGLGLDPPTSTSEVSSQTSPPKIPSSSVIGDSNTFLKLAGCERIEAEAFSFSLPSLDRRRRPLSLMCPLRLIFCLLTLDPNSCK
jgi:hypothetical protein